MKTRKILSLITVLALMLSVVALPVYAVDTSAKISKVLKTAMQEADPGEQISVVMWTVDIDHNAAKKLAEEKSGMTKEQIDQMCRDNTISKDEQNRIVDNYIRCLREANFMLTGEIADEVFAECGITDDEIEFRGEFAPMHMLRIGVDKINKLAECNKVATLGYSEDAGYKVFMDGKLLNGASVGEGIKLEDGNLVGGADGKFTVNIAADTVKKNIFEKMFRKYFGLLRIDGELIPKKGVTATTSTKTYIQFGENGTKELISNIAYSKIDGDVPDYSFPKVGEHGFYSIMVDNTFNFDGNSFTLINDDFDFKISSIFLSVGRQVLPAGRLSEPEPDVKSTAIGQTASSLNDGDSTKLYTTIRNSGEDGFYEGSLEISFTVDGKVIDTVTYDKRIEVGESVTVKSNKDWKASFGAHTVKAVIKPSEKAFAKASSIKERTNVTDN